MVKRKKSIFILGSVLIGVVTVLVVMLVLAGAGAVNASPDSLIISSASVSKIYDGTSLSDASWTIDKGALRDGHTAEVTVTGRQKTVGSCENKLTVNIYDAAGKDVTGDYDITLNPGTLTVLARSYEIHSVNATKEYDGTPLTAEKYIEASGSLASGHSVRVSFSGSLQNVGTAENKFTAKVYDEKNYDVTENYKLDCLPGTLEVTRRAVTFKSGDASKEYDGTPLENKDISLATGTYAVGQSATFDASAEITEPGVKQNEFAAHIIDADGNDVSDNYDITYITGKLEVIKRAVTFKSGDASKEYDGYPLYASDHTAIAGSYVSTHAPAYSAPVTLTVPGTMQNTFTVTFTDADGNDVTAYYDISYVYGTLEVKRRTVTFKSPNAAKQYDGAPLFDENVEVYTGEVYYEHSVYFYDCATITDVGTAQNTFVPSITDRAGNRVDEYYDIKYIYGTLTVSPARLTVRSSDSSRAYNGTALTSEAWSVYDNGWKYSNYSSTGILLDGGNTVSATVDGTITDVGTARNNIYAVIYNASGEDVTRNYEIDYDYGTLEVTKQTITVRSTSASRVYNGNALTSGAWSVYDSTEHNAYSAGTRLSLVGGNTVSAQISGTITDVGSVRNTIRVAVSRSGIDVTRNYDIVYDYGTLEVTKQTITVRSTSASRVYNGNALTNGAWSVYDSRLHNTSAASNTITLADYNTVAATISGTITDVGSVRNTIRVAVSRSGVDVTRNYDIVYDYGTLEVTRRAVTLRSSDASKQYDGTPLTNGNVSVASGSYVSGQTPTYNATASITVPGTAQNVFTARIRNSAGSDVTSNYEISYLYGTLEVLKRAMTLRSGDASKLYDGTPLTNGNVSVASGSYVSGQTPTYNATASITVPGTAQNVFTVRIRNNAGSDVTSNYEISYLYGTLEVLKRAVTFKSPNAAKRYDARPLSDTNVGVYIGEVYSGHTVSYNGCASITDVGSIQNTFVPVITDGTGNRVDEYYDIKTVYGTLEVTKQTITVRSTSASRVYNGTALTSGAWSVYDNAERYASLATTSIALIDGNTVSAAISGTITDVGSVRNTIHATVSRSGVDKTRNYDIIYDYGTLEVTPAQITVESSTASKIYDGSALTSRTFRVFRSSGWSAYVNSGSTVSLYGGDRIIVSINGTITDAGTAKNLFSITSINKSTGINASGNYDVRYVEGTLTVYKRTITVRSATASKRYDRTPLVNAEWTLYDNSGLAGEFNTYEKTIAGTNHTVTASVNGTITEPGSVPNYFAYVAVTDARGADVTVNYEIKEQPGTLTIYTDGGFSLTSNSKPTGEIVLTIRSDKDGRVLLKQSSAGDFRGNGFAAAPNYGDTLDGEAGYWYLATYALQGKAEAANASIELITAPAVAPYYLTTEKGDMQPSDVLIVMTGNYYDVKYYDYMLDVGTRNVLKSASLPPVYSANEQAYREFVYSKYTVVPEATKTYLQGLIDKYSLKESDTASTVTAVAEYIRHAAKYNLSYNSALDAESNMVIAFLDEYKEGVCRHYAAAATMMYRTLGLPARYTVGVAADTKADTLVGISDYNYHAWVEVYFDGIGWIAIDVTGSGSSSSGGQDDNVNSPIIIKPRDAEKQYDGTPLTPAQNFVQGLTDYINSGYTYTASISGSQTAVGKSNSEIAEFVMYDPDGSLFTRYVCGVRRDGAKLDGAEFKTGTLHVYEFVLRVNTPTATKVYDGTPLSNHNYTCSGLQSGHRIAEETVIMPECTDTGFVENTFDAKIVDASGADVTDRYKINVNAGLLIVSMCEITVTTGSAEAKYDALGGDPLMCSNYTVQCGDTVIESTGMSTNLGAIVAGATIVVTMRGAQYNIGSCQNEVNNLIITDENGKEITGNFKIKYVLGTLTVE